MRTTVHITGTSAGLGNALARVLLQNEEVQVHGYSRRPANISHPHYIHHQVDLANADSYTALQTDKEAEREVLINNAGWIGPVDSIGKLPPGDSSKLMTINVSAVLEWTNHFVHTSIAKERTVISISSGAGKNAIASWSTYCASKAAIDMATRVWTIDEPTVQFLSIAPGVVDTDMQQDIRRTSPSSFPDRQRFVNLHADGNLVDPMKVAEQISTFVFWPAKAPSNVFSVRDL